jgi:FkbM family methyltransferase
MAQQALGQRSFRQRVELAILRLVRNYTFNTPVKKGTYRLFTFVMSKCRSPQPDIVVPTLDGRKIAVDLTSGMEETVFFHGRYEPFLTEVSTALIQPGDICIDAGANFGWYSTLFATLVGENGAVHAFEPVGRMFEQLRTNCELLKINEHVFTNQTALGDKIGPITINLFSGESTGRASISTQGRSDVVPIECEMVTLDSYLESRSVEAIDFVKLDIEGGEMMFFKGAELLLQQDPAPTMLIEISTDIDQHFGYHPNDLLDLLSKNVDYVFFAADEIRGRLNRLTRFEKGSIGANVFCIPQSLPEKLSAISKFLDT